jgi:mRNA interferase MazF
MAVNPRHGEVWLADMGLAAKVRPVIALLADDLDVERTLIVHVPITTQGRGGPLEVPVGHLRFLDPTSVANVQAIGSLPRVRFQRRLGVLLPDDLDRVKQAIRLAVQM